MQQMEVEEKEVSVKELLQSIKSWFFFILKQWWKIAIVAMLGAGLAIAYRLWIPISYNAKSSFVVEEGRTTSGGLASLAGQFGFDLSGATGATLFTGDNILIFFKSNSLTKETLLTEYDSTTKFSLADKYAEVYGLREKWAESKKIGKEIFFKTNQTSTLTRLQDSLLQTIINRILKKELTVERPEKKATFIVVQCSFRDELLSKLFCERLVNKATDWYVESKTKRQRINVERLQKRADSLEQVLNGRTFYTAATQETTLDVNPAASTAAVKLEVSSRNKIMISQVYAEVIKNLEIGKVQLSQETPTILRVDNPDTPLPKTKRQFILYGLIGIIIFSLFSIFYFTVKRMIN